jgi:hypothetical protein
MFGTQLAKHGKIIDYSCANHYWEEIYTNPSLNWDDYKEIYQPIYNKLSTDFRLVAPKNKQ